MSSGERAADGVNGAPATDTPLEAVPAEAHRAFGDRLSLAERYAASLAGDATTRGLIGPREGSRIWTRHVLNSLLVEPHVPPGGRLLDVGSGAGLPGIPLAIARPDLLVTLCEPLERRTRYLDLVVADLGLGNTTVVRSRAEQLGGSFDVITARAVASIAVLVPVGARLLAPGGAMLLLKGRTAGDELAAAAGILRRSGFVSTIERPAASQDSAVVVIRRQEG